MRQGPSSAVRNSLLILALLSSTATGQGPEIRLTPLRTAPPGERAQERGSLVYSNGFDDASALDAFTILGDGQVSVESGQVRFDVPSRATAILNADVDFSPGYNSVLSANSGLISWSFNLSNQDGNFNNGFHVVLASTQSDPFSISADGYYFRGGGLVGDRMGLWRFDFGLGGGQEVLIDVIDGLGTLPEKGSIRITFDPTTDVWSMFAVVGPEYVDPTSVDNLLGTATDGTYTTVPSPFVGFGGRGTGVIYYDNFEVSVAGAGLCLNNDDLAGTPCGSSATTSCTNPDTCDGAGQCLDNHEPAGAPCGVSASSDCDAPDTCNGAGSCLQNLEPFGTACPDDGIECTNDICNAGVCTHSVESNCTLCSIGACIDNECVYISPLIYADKSATTGTGDGSSWANAFVDLQEALALARECPDLVEEIWVAAGIYTPAPPNGNRYTSFELVSGVGLYGGFGGWKTSRNDRDWKTNPTTLSGDLSGNRRSDSRGHGGNSYTVVTTVNVSAATVLDGFTITGGYAFGEASSGAGMSNYNGSPTVSNCTFSHNAASDFGGGMLNRLSSPAITNCLFRRNTSFAGGGMHNGNGSAPILTNCTFVENAAHKGGALRVSSATTVSNCVFWDNGLEGIGTSDSSSLTISHSTIQGGYAGVGNVDRDPLFVDPNGDYRLTPCSPCNDAGDNASVPTGVDTDLDGSPRLHNGVVDMGAYEFQGDALPPTVSALTSVAASDFEYCDRVVVTWDDVPSADGYSIFRNGAYLDESSGSPFTDLNADAGREYRYHITAWNGCDSSISNTALGGRGFAAGGMTGYPFGGLSGFASFAACLVGPQSRSNSQVSSCSSACLFSFNYDDDGDVDMYDFSVYQSGCASIDCDDGQFCNGTEACGAGGVCHSGFAADCNQNGIEDSCEISDGTAADCDENGVPDECETVDNDCDENRRPDNCDIADGTLADVNGNGVPDQCENVIFVNAAAAPGGSGTSWADAFSDLRSALFEASAPGQIWVAAGTYRPSESGGDRAATFQLVDGVAVYGGFNGTESSLDERSWADNETILSGDLNNVGSANVDNSIHVVTASGVGSSAILDGVTVTRGYADIEGGGGIYILNASPTIRNCTIVGNVTGLRFLYDAPHGGGIYCLGGSPTFVNCVLRDNHAAPATVDFTNRGAGDGGGAYFMSSSPFFARCTIAGNYSGPGGPSWCELECAPTTGGPGGSGGGLYFVGCTVTIVDSVIAFNIAGDGGPGATCSSLKGQCVSLGPGSGGGSGGGLYVEDSTVNLRNCTVYGNRAGFSGFSHSGSANQSPGGAIWGNVANVTIMNSIIWDNQPADLGQNRVDGPAITYSNVQQVYAGQGNISAEPMFVDADGADNSSGTADDDFRLLDVSPCPNKGDATFLPEPGALDQAGNPRLQGCRVDMGAIESTLSCGSCSTDAHCDDSVGCTDDVCSAGTCRFIANTENCSDDGLYCNGSESCHPDLGCISSGSPCEPGELCDEENDSCGT